MGKKQETNSELARWLDQWAEQTLKAEEARRPFSEQIRVLQEQADAAAKAFEDEARAIEEETIVPLIKMLGAGGAGQLGKVVYRAPYERVSYDNSKVEAVIAQLAQLVEAPRVTKTALAGIVQALIAARSATPVTPKHTLSVSIKPAQNNTPAPDWMEPPAD